MTTPQAIKKLHNTSSTVLGSPQKGRPRAGSRETKSVLDTDECRFLMVTRHPRLVMFMARCFLPDHYNYFLYKQTRLCKSTCTCCPLRPDRFACLLCTSTTHTTGLRNTP